MVMIGATSSEAVAADAASAPRRRPNRPVFQLWRVSFAIPPSSIFGTAIAASSKSDGCVWVIVHFGLLKSGLMAPYT